MSYTTNTTNHGNPDPAPEMPVEGSNPTMPPYIRLPKAGSRCYWTGLSRSKLNQLILPCDANGHSPPVKSVSLVPRGTIKGTRLILFESLMNHLQQQTQNEND